MNDDLDLLDLDDTEESVDDTLPEAPAFATPRPHRPWLLMGIGIAVIVLAVFIIIRVVGNNSSSSMEVDLGEPVVVEEKAVEVIGADTQAAPVVVDSVAVAPMPTQVLPVQEPQPVAPVVQPVAPVAPVVAQQPVAVQDTSVRVVKDRKDVKFNPQKETPAPKPVKVSAPKLVKTATKSKAAAKPVQKQTVQKVANGGWYVQFGSYGTREAAAAAEKKIRAGHANLFQGKQFVILAAVLPNGQTTYRLRVAFASSNDANGFCRNAKSDGLDCYVAK